MPNSHRLSAIARHVTPASGAASSKKVLSGVKVVELATVVAGPTAAAMLADMGAEVIKVENPDRPDEARSYGRRETPDSEPSMEGVFQQYNRGKRGVALNIQSDQGRSLLKRLLAEADVFVTNVRLQSLQKLGLDYDSLKDEFPSLVYGQLSAWGLQGEMVKDPGYDFGGKRSSSLNFALLLPKRPQQLLRSLLGIQRRDGRDPLERDGGHAPFPRCYRRLHDSDAAVHGHRLRSVRPAHHGGRPDGGRRAAALRHHGAGPPHYELRRGPGE